MKIWNRILSAAGICAAMLSGACANMGTPSGGPRDEDPPRFVSANPPMGAVNVDREKIVLTFNELINVKDAFSKVVVSPVSKSTPRVSSLGRRVTVEFDSLAPNTTYTIDFGDAIEDNNEGNPLQGFAYTFSTGPEIDTLRISGRVLSARALEPQQAMTVGVYPADGPDSLLTTTPFLRVARTDDRGQFTIRGLSPGRYRVFALADNDNNHFYSSPEEDMAFYEFEVSPSAEQTTASDSIYDPLTGKLDSVRERIRTRFLPNDILLRSFNSEIRQQYMTKYERLDSTRIYLKFNTRSDSLPQIRFIGMPDGTRPGVLEASERLDSLVWWLSPDLMRTDSLRLEVIYPKSDQNLISSLTVDTLDFFTKRAPAPKKKKKEKRQRLSATDSIAAITTTFKVTSAAQQDVHLPVRFEVPSPLSRLDTTAFRLSVLVDSVYNPAAGSFHISMPDSLQPRHFTLDYPWEYGATYRLEADTMAATDIYGKPTRPLTHDFTVKKPGEYCTLLFHVTGGPADTPMFVELLDGNDRVQRTAVVEGNDAFFPFLTPGRYYARVVLDLNGNGLYDTGNYALGLEPELVYYYPKAVNIKKNWDKEEAWALFDTPVDMMKPLAITKNKPAVDKRARNNNSDETDEEEDEIFDPTVNPFDPNDKARKRARQRTAGSY